MAVKKPVLIRSRWRGHLYLQMGNRRRRILLPQVAAEMREIFPGIELKTAGKGTIDKLEPGAVVPRQWSDADWIEPPDNKQMMREIIVSRLVGNGVEYGAGSRPMPLPVETEVSYAEPFQSDEQYNRMGYDKNTVVPRYSNPIENQHEIESDSLDFVVAAHVIEHTPNPIGAIVESFRTLRSGGHLVLVVPDKRRTFDKRREDTDLDHLIADYEQPDRQRDLENYLDFFTKAKNLGDAAENEANMALEKGIDIHYHVWTPGSFYQMMRHIRDNYAQFRSFEIKPPVDDETCLEFYMVAEK